MEQWGARIMASPNAAAIDGSILISIPDKHISWIFRCRTPVTIEQLQQVKEEISCEIRLGSYAFQRLLDKDLTLQQAMLEGEMDFSGESSKALAFFALACPGGVCE